VVNRLPKTRTGKILRRSLRALLCNEEVVMPATIEDPNVIQDLDAAIKAWRRGTAKQS
jgi:propionyl-CoA synthetase